MTASSMCGITQHCHDVCHGLQPDIPEHSMQGYQSFAEACGRLQMIELRDTFIRQLNSFVFTIPEDSAEAGRHGCCATMAS